MSRRLSMLLSVLLLSACGDDDGGGGGGGGDGGADDAGSIDAPPAGPLAVAGSDRMVLGGLVVPLDSGGSQGTGFQWTSDDGLTVSGAADPIAYVAIPDVAAGTSYRFQLTVTDGTDQDTDDVTVTVMEAAFDDFLADITDANQLNVSEGITFLGDAMWIVNMDTNSLSRFDASGAYVERHDLVDNPVGMNRYTDGRLAVANSVLGRVDLVEPATGDLSTLFDQLEGGGAVGAANYPLPDSAGNLFVSTRASLTVVRYDAADDAARVFIDLDGIAVNPNSIAFGPEPDQLYVGTRDAVYRVPIHADGSAGSPVVYVDAIPSDVDGLVFDEGRNLWIGCPNTEDLLVAPYVAGGPTEVSRSWNGPDAGNSRFVNTTFGNAAFGETTLYWTNLGDRTVGRLPVGLRGLVPPLAP